MTNKPERSVDEDVVREMDELAETIIEIVDENDPAEVYQLVRYEITKTLSFRLAKIEQRCEEMVREEREKIDAKVEDRLIEVRHAILEMSFATKLMKERMLNALTEAQQKVLHHDEKPTA